jgi:hypothetical protein
MARGGAAGGKATELQTHHYLDRYRVEIINRSMYGDAPPAGAAEPGFTGG